MAFDSAKFKKQMRKMGITQKQVAEALDKKERTINDWLSSSKNLRSDKVQILCTIIDVDPREYDPDWVGSLDTSNQPTPTVNAKISSAAKNGFWLLKQRYGVSEKDIIEIAPVMFAVLADQAKSIGHTWWEEFEKMKHQAKIKGLPNPEWGRDTHEMIEKINSAIEASQQDMIFGEEQTGNSFNPYLAENLFSKALLDLTAKSKNIDLQQYYEGHCPKSVGQKIDKEEVEIIAGEDVELVNAIWRGDIQLFGRDFQSFDDPVERTKWMKKEIIKMDNKRRKDSIKYKAGLNKSHPHLDSNIKNLAEERRKRKDGGKKAK